MIKSDKSWKYRFNKEVFIRIKRNKYQRYYIYGLFDSRDGKCFYVGVSHDVSARTVNPETYSAPRIKSFLRELSASGADYTAKVLEETSPENRFSRERYWISKFYGDGCVLQNTRHNPGIECDTPRLLVPNVPSDVMDAVRSLIILTGMSKAEASLHLVKLGIEHMALQNANRPSA